MKGRSAKLRLNKDYLRNRILIEIEIRNSQATVKKLEHNPQRTWLMGQSQWLRGFHKKIIQRQFLREKHVKLIFNLLFNLISSTF